MDLDSVFSMRINKRNVGISTQRLPPMRLQRVLFPRLVISDDGDKYFEELWRTIDGSKHYVWVLMYHFDETRIGEITLEKLSQAAKRGSV